MIRIRISNLWIKNVSIMRHTNTFGRIFLLNSPKKLSSKQKFTQFHSSWSAFWKLHVQLARCEIRILWNNSKYLRQNFPDRPLIFPHENPISTVSAHIDPDCIPTSVAQPYPHLSKVFDQPLNDQAPKIFETLASQLYSFTDPVSDCSISRFSFEKAIST